MELSFWDLRLKMFNILFEERSRWTECYNTKLKSKIDYVYWDFKVFNILFEGR